MGFASLQHLQGLKIHLPRALPARFVPPSGFGYPLNGLLPADPGRFCFTPAALMGFTLRSFLLSKGILSFPTGWTHLLFISRYTQRPKARGRRGKPQFLGFDPFESPLQASVGLGRRPPDAPLGFSLPGLLVRSLDRDFAQSPLTRFCVTI